MSDTLLALLLFASGFVVGAFVTFVVISMSMGYMMSKKGRGE